MTSAKPEPSSKSALEKMGIKGTQTGGILMLPEEGLRAFGSVPKSLQLQTRLQGPYDFLIGFYSSKTDLKSDLAKAKKLLKNSGMIWVCWKKGNVTELNRDDIAALALEKEFETVAAISVNQTWSGLKLMYSKNLRSN